MRRRDFLQSAAALPLGLVAACRATGSRVAGSRVAQSTAAERSADLVIIGGGLGGCAAALSAARAGLRVILTEETDWIGGQLTQQAVPPDENRWIETIGGTASYQSLRAGIREHYRTQYPLTDRARANPLLNPGNGWVSRLCCEPRAALAVLLDLLRPHIASGNVQLLLRHQVRAVDTHGDRVRAVRVHDVEANRDVLLHAPFFADATELGELLPLSGTEYREGAESIAQTGEPHAKTTPQPDNQQSFTMCFAMDYRPGEDHTIARPNEYGFWRDHMVVADDERAYRLLSFDDPANARLGFDPIARTGYWSYRRVVDRDVLVPSAAAGDVTIVNWGLNDYALGPLCGVSATDAARHIARAKELSLSLMYWLQTEAPRPDGAAGWKGLRVRPDIMGTADGFAKYPYIRESRRIQAEFTVLEQHLTTEARQRESPRSAAELVATPYHDTVGIGHYNMDLHLTTRGDRGRYGSTLPFQIPLGALIPQRVENLLPACKNLGVTHLTNGCFRLHPIEWNIGESVGNLVAFSLARQTTPRAVRQKSALLADFQSQLTRTGVRLSWPTPLPT